MELKSVRTSTPMPPSTLSHRFRPNRVYWGLWDFPDLRRRLMAASPGMYCIYKEKSTITGYFLVFRHQNEVRVKQLKTTESENPAKCSVVLTDLNVAYKSFDDLAENLSKLNGKRWVNGEKVFFKAPFLRPEYVLCEEQIVLDKVAQPLEPLFGTFGTVSKGHLLVEEAPVDGKPVYVWDTKKKPFWMHSVDAAVKVGSNEMGIESLFKEAEVLMKLRGTRYYPFFFGLAVHESVKLVMELIPGDNLMKHFSLNPATKEDGPLLLHIATEIASALHELGVKGFQRFDVRPDNVMLTPAPGEQIKFVVKLVDLGFVEPYTPERPERVDVQRFCERILRQFLVPWSAELPNFAKTPYHRRLIHLKGAIERGRITTFDEVMRFLKAPIV